MAKKARKEAPAPPEVEGDLNIQDMLARNVNKYLLVNLLAKRAQEIKRGGRPLVQLAEPFTALEVAITEGAGGLLKVEKKKKETRVVNLVEAQ